MSSRDTSQPESDEQRNLRVLLEDLKSRNHYLAPSPALGADLAKLSESHKAEFWRRVHEFYKQHVLRQSASIVLHAAKKHIRYGGSTELIWAIWLDKAHRIGLDWHDGTLFVRRVGPESGGGKIYARSKS